MNYEYLTFEENYPVANVTEGPVTTLDKLLEGSWHRNLTDDELVDILISEAKSVSPFYAIGWLGGTIKHAIRSGITRKTIIDEIVYLQTREKEND